MPITGYWADKYVENKKTAAQAIAMIKPAQRVFIGSSCGEPQHLVRKLSEASNYFKDIEINRLMTLESALFTWARPNHRPLPAISASSRRSIFQRSRVCLKADCCRFMSP